MLLPIACSLVGAGVARASPEPTTASPPESATASPPAPTSAGTAAATPASPPESPSSSPPAPATAATPKPAAAPAATRTTAAPPAGPEPQLARCKRHGCPIEAVRFFHPLSTHLGVRGGPMIGFVSHIDDRGDPTPDTMQPSLGWQMRGDAIGLPGKLGPFVDVLYSVEARWGHGERVLLPSVEVAHASAPTFPIMQWGIGVGLPLRSRAARPADVAALGETPSDVPGELRAGVGFYLHQHWFAVVDGRIGLEWFPFAAHDGVTGTMSLHVTL